VLNGFALGKQARNGKTPYAEIFESHDMQLAVEMFRYGNADVEKIFWAIQGKSLRSLPFNANDLIASNRQLRAVDPQLMKSGYVVPENGDLSVSLAGKVVVLSPSKS